MKNNEFSDTFTTLLNSYNTQAQFGEQASRREIVLDEYEKSVLLTQAQDIIIKSYFDGTLNQQGQGFDDSTRRQMDFSSLIKVAELRPLCYNTENFRYGTNMTSTSIDGVKSNYSNPYTENEETIKSAKNITDELGNPAEKNDIPVTTFDDRGIIYQLPRKTIMMTDANGRYNGVQKVIRDTTDVLFILNERLVARITTAVNSVGAAPIGYEYKQKDYVIVPINYKEYDREMSKPYAQPLKKQAWRLFQNSTVGFDINTELIPRFNVVPKGDGTNVGDVVFFYKIRYVKRPRPIILEDLPNDLEIDGESLASECELNPIIHMDILNKAVELAIATRGGSTTSGVPQPQQQSK